MIRTVVRGAPATMSAEPECALAIARAMASPRPVPDAVRPRARVNRSNASDANPAGKPAPSSVTSTTTRPASSRARETHLALAVTQGVVDEVPDRLLDPRPVDARAGVAGASTTISRPASAAVRAKRPRPARAALAARPAGGEANLALVGARDHEQVLGEPGEPVDLLRRGAQCRAQLVGRAARALGQLELGAQDRQRRPQLVAGVRDEDALALERAPRCGRASRSASRRGGGPRRRPPAAGGARRSARG